MSFLDRIIQILSQLLASSGDTPGESGPSSSGPAINGPTVLTPAFPTLNKVLLVSYDPSIPSAGGRRLTEVMGWKQPQNMASAFINDMQNCSHGFARFEVVDEVTMNSLPVKADGFQYQPDEFLSFLRANSGFHQPDAADYDQMLEENDIPGRIERGEIDEAWFFGPPYSGFYESRMLGPGAFWCNAPPLQGTQYGDRRSVVMGFNYERGIGEMLESMGHRAESILLHAFRRAPAGDDLWERFIRIEQTHHGRSEVGTVHFAPNSTRDYDWGNREYVISRCNTWLNFPDLDGLPVRVNCDAWGSGDMRLHHLWWMERFPHVEGRTAGIANNWWSIILDPNQVR